VNQTIDISTLRKTTTRGG
jgi:adenine C2-methylase RlmN of 23S rRNA A2503 and tRNA A37